MGDTTARVYQKMSTRLRVVRRVLSRNSRCIILHNYNKILFILRSERSSAVARRCLQMFATSRSREDRGKVQNVAWIRVVALEDLP